MGFFSSLFGGGGGDKTTTMQPPDWQIPYVQRGLQQSQGLYNRGPQVVGFSPQTEEAMRLTQNRALQGSGLTQGAQDYAQKTLSGGFLGSNPYLDQTFNQAALATQNQLASEFGGMGRNVDASQGLRAQQLNGLATNIYGGAYDAERNRQQQVLPLAHGLAQADYDDINRLGGVGQQVENKAQQYQNAPGNALDDYLRRVSGNLGQTQTQGGGGSNLFGQILGGGLGLLGGLF